LPVSLLGDNHQAKESKCLRSIENSSVVIKEKHEANVKASVGLAMRIPSVGLKGAWGTADQMMYEAKARNKSGEN
jgi:PleD family two-component response regulator